MKVGCRIPWTSAPAGRHRPQATGIRIIRLFDNTRMTCGIGAEGGPVLVPRASPRTGRMAPEGLGASPIPTEAVGASWSQWLFAFTSCSRPSRHIRPQSLATSCASASTCRRQICWCCGHGAGWLRPHRRRNRTGPSSRPAAATSPPRPRRPSLSVHPATWRPVRLCASENLGVGVVPLRGEWPPTPQSCHFRQHFKRRCWARNGLLSQAASCVTSPSQTVSTQWASVRVSGSMASRSCDMTATSASMPALRRPLRSSVNSQ